MESAFGFHFESIPSFDLPEQQLISWLKTVAVDHKYAVEDLSVVLCTDDFLHNLNVQYLEHDTLTDIITFDYNEGKTIIGELYISVERVKENATIHSCSFEDEFHRVLVHGVLHLVGYKDKNEADQSEMRSKEDYYLSLRDF
jgi:probable rRNA maturation factor